MKINYALFAVVMILMSCAPKTDPETDASPSFIRYEASTEQGIKNLTSLNKALDSMKKLEETYPLSWYYQAAIHLTPPKDLYANTYYHGDSLSGWNSCPHMLPSTDQFHFLTWHRLYLLHFEEIIRKFSGDDDFTLPYWDYSSNQSLPKQYQYYSKDTFSNLYVSSRSPTLNFNDTIARNYKDAIAVTCDKKGNIITCGNKDPFTKILDTTRYLNIKNTQLFSHTLEDGMHNCMHDYIGGAVNPADSIAFWNTATKGGPINLSNNIYNSYFYHHKTMLPNDKSVTLPDGSVVYYTQTPASLLSGLMADVPSAAFDPIFWLHHANIDRMWAQWEHKHTTSIDMETFTHIATNVSYIFFDTSGNQIPDYMNGSTANLQNIYNATYNVDYRYLVNSDTIPIQNHSSETETTLEKSAEQIVATNTSVTEIKSSGKVISVGLDKELTSNASNIDERYLARVRIAYNGDPNDFLILGSGTGSICSKDSLDTDSICNIFDSTNSTIIGFFGSPEDHHSHHGHHGNLGTEYQFDVTETIKKAIGNGHSQVSVYAIPIVHGAPDLFRVVKTELVKQ